MDRGMQIALLEQVNRREIPRSPLIRPLVKGWIRVGKRIIHRRPEIAPLKQNRITWPDLPQELRDRVVCILLSIVHLE